MLQIKKSWPIFLLSVVIVGSALAGVPRTMNYQGQLLNASSQPVPDANYSMTFKIYTDTTGGTVLWTESRTVPVAGGLYSVNLGQVNPIPDSVFAVENVAFRPALEVTVNSEILSPRVRLTSAPTALASNRIIGDFRSMPGQLSLGRLPSGGTSDRFNAELLADSNRASLGLEDSSGAGVFFGVGNPEAVFGRSDVSVSLAKPYIVVKDSTGDTLLKVTDGNVVTSGNLQSGHSIVINGTSGLITSTTGQISFDNENLVTTGKVQTNQFQMPTGATAGYVLTSDAVGFGGWQPVGTIGGCWLCPIGNYTYLSANDDSVGIGTATPTEKLTVTGPGRFGNGQFDPWSLARKGLIVAKQGADSWGRSNNDTTGIYLPSNTTDYSVIYGKTNATRTDMVLTVGDDPDDHILLMPSGSVGVGTTNPAAKLDVSGTTRTLGFEMPTGATNGYVLTSNASGVGTWQAASGGGSSCWTCPGPYTILSDISDNVGIGTATPTVKLHVVGDARITSRANIGNNNTNAGTLALVVGENGIASGNWSTVTGGFGNQATASHTTVGGGRNNTASADTATVSGGGSNTASGVSATVSGGQHNTASQYSSTVSGGFGNQATASYATVSGGFTNTSKGAYSTVGGGSNNVSDTDYTFVGGGGWNKAISQFATVAGGDSNMAQGVCATVPGGYNNRALSEYSFAAGRGSTAGWSGSFVWSDASGTGATATGANQFLIDAIGGVGIGTASPTAALDVDVSSLVGVRAAEFRNNYAAGGVLAATVTIENTNATGIAVNATANSTDAALIVNNTNAAGALLKCFGPGFAVKFRVNSNGTVGIGNDAPNSALHVSGPIATAFATVVGNTTLDGTHSVVKTTNAGAITITLPTAIGITGRQYTVKRTAAGLTNVGTSAGQTIDGAAPPYALSAQWKYVTVVSDGANWLIVANN